MDARPQQEPPLALWAAICIGLLLGAVAIGVVLGGVMPLPYGPAAPVEQYVAEQPAAVQVIAVGVFASAVPLAVYAATAGARLRELGAAVPGAIALTGGTLATGTLGLTGLVGWVLSRPGGGAAAALVRVLYYLAFLTGGPAHIVALGLLVAGMSVPGVTLGLLPRPLAYCGVAVAVLAGLTTLVLIWPILGVMLPIARVSALAWLLVAGARLGRSHRHSGC
ncbi:hypothetical protein [Mycobacterium celatum]|uniref:DUF4386 domain-containing protein n=1 Tax=Mycobacterium celatum TaxID=28045 RepID=A0A2G5PPR0_MYCCE|nr:hypothetical protein [Mycobacterium celatum]PIB80259.1 hypothetical protein CQY23_04390 [Mycobacterium celatum]